MSSKLWLHAFSHIPIYWDLFLGTSQDTDISSLSLRSAQISCFYQKKQINLMFHHITECFRLVLRLELAAKWGSNHPLFMDECPDWISTHKRPLLSRSHAVTKSASTLRTAAITLWGDKSPENKSHQCLCNFFALLEGDLDVLDHIAAPSALTFQVESS